MDESVMSLILIVSVIIRLIAMGWSIMLLQRMRDWRLGFLTMMLGLMAMRQSLTLLAEKEGWPVFITGYTAELSGLIVSIMAFLAVFCLERIIVEQKRAKDLIQHLQSVLKGIRNVNQLIVHEKNQQKLLQGACEILHQTRNYRLVWIGLVEEGTKDVLPAAQAGFEEGYLKSIKITWDDSETGKGPTGTAIKTQKPFVMRDIASDSRFKPWREEAIKRGYASSAAVPLVHENRVFGVLDVYATLPDSFDEEELSLLLEVGRDVAFALHNIELEEEHKQVEEELQRRRDENMKLTVIVEERSELQEWINTFDTFVGKFDPDGVVGILFNETPLKAGGLTRDDVVGKYFPDTRWWSHSTTERARIVECFERAKAGLSSRIETDFRSADGTPVPIIFNCQPVIDDGGKVKYITVEGKVISIC